MNPMKTKVERFGAGWAVYVYRFGIWQRTPDFYETRFDALTGRAYWASA